MCFFILYLLLYLLFIFYIISILQAVWVFKGGGKQIEKKSLKRAYFLYYGKKYSKIISVKTMFVL